MPSRAEAAELLRIVGLYVPRPQVRQMLGDLLRSRCAEAGCKLSDIVALAMAEYDASEKQKG